MPTIEPICESTPAPPASDAAQLERLLHLLTPEVDRRNQSRVAAPYLFLLTPLEDLGRGRPGEETGSSLTVVGKDISHQGIGFYHEQPLAHRFVRLTIDDPQIGFCQIDLQLNRCRFTKLGWYESGGRILKISD